MAEAEQQQVDDDRDNADEDDTTDLDKVAAAALARAPEPKPEADPQPQPSATTKKKRKGSNMARGKPDNPSSDGVPYDEIQKAIESAQYTHVICRISRRNDKGQLGMVWGSLHRELNDLFTIEEFCRQYAGGGNYRVEPRDPNNLSKYAIKPFRFNIEGPSFPPQHVGGSSSAPNYPAGAQPPMNNPYQPPPPNPWVDGLHPHNRAGGFQQNTPSHPHAYAQPHYPPAPGATVASDRLAMQELTETKAALAKMTEKFDHAMQRFEDERSRMHREIDAAKEEAREQKHRAEMAALEAKFGGGAAASSQPTTDYAGIATAFAPVLAALVTSRESSATKNMEIQSQGLTALMNATLTQANRPDPTSQLVEKLMAMGMSLGPVLLPLAKEMMGNRGPEAQAKLFNSMTENHLHTISMMAQLMEAFGSQGEDRPWWLEPIKETLDGVISMTQAYMNDSQGLPGQRPMMMPPGPQHAFAAPPQPQQQPQQPPSTISYQTIDAVGSDVAPPQRPPNALREIPQEEPEDAELVGDDDAGDAADVLDDLSLVQRAMLRQLPPQFQTPEWHQIIIYLHEDDSEADNMAVMITKHLEHLLDFGMLPPQLADLQEDPAGALSRLVSPLPVSHKRPDFVRDLLQLTIDALIEDEYVKIPDATLQEPVDESAAPAQTAVTG